MELTELEQIRAERLGSLVRRIEELERRQGEFSGELAQFSKECADTLSIVESLSPQLGTASSLTPGLNPDRFWSETEKLWNRSAQDQIDHLPSHKIGSGSGSDSPAGGGAKGPRNQLRPKSGKLNARPARVFAFGARAVPDSLSAVARPWSAR